MKINGREIKGIKRISGETKSLRGYYGNRHLYVYLDDDGELHSELYVGCHGNTWVEGNGIIGIAHLSDPTTMQEIAEMIEERLSEIECNRRWQETTEV